MQPDNRFTRRYKMLDVDRSQAGDVDWVSGTCMLARRSAFEAVEGFDEAYFMYGEEMDWCRRIRRAGWSIVFLPEPAVIHVGGASSGPIAGPMFVENLRGRLRFLSKHRSSLVVMAARATIAVSVLLRFAWREAQALGLSLMGRPVPEPLRLRLTSLSAAARWVLRGLPL